MIRNKAFYRTFFALCLPIVLQNMISLSVNLADNLMLGRYAEASLSGVTAANQIQFVYQQIIFGCSEGMMVLASQYFGMGETKEMKRVAGVAMWTAIAFMCGLFMVVSIIPEQMIGIFTKDSAIITEGAKYIGVVRFSYPFFCVTTVLLTLLKSAKDVKIALVLSISTLLINCGINYVLIYGHFGFPELGVQGAAIGTVTARIIEFLILLGYLSFREKKLKIRLKNFLHLDRLLVKDYFKLTIPMLLISGLWGVNTALQTAVLGNLSSAAIAANSMASNLYLLVKTMAVGEAAATAVMIGNAIGEGKTEKELRQYAKTFQILFIIVGVCSGLILYCISGPVLALYNFSDEARGLARTFINILCFVMVGMCYQMPTNGGIIKGGGSTNFVVIEDLISIWGIVVPLSLIVAFVLKAEPWVVVICLNLDQIFKCIPAGLKCNFGHWYKKLTRDRKPKKKEKAVPKTM